MVTMVLLNVALMWAMPRLTLRRCFLFLLLATVALPPVVVGHVCNVPSSRGRGTLQTCPTEERTSRGGDARAGLAGARAPPPRRVVVLLGFLDALLAGDGLARPLAGAGVGAGALAAAGQAAAVADA